MRAPASCGPIRRLRAVPIGHAILPGSIVRIVRASRGFGKRSRPEAARDLSMAGSTAGTAWNRYTTGVACPSPAFTSPDRLRPMVDRVCLPRKGRHIGSPEGAVEPSHGRKPVGGVGGMDKSAVALHTDFGIGSGKADFASVPQWKPVAQPPSAGEPRASRRRWLKRPLCHRQAGCVIARILVTEERNEHTR